MSGSFTLGMNIDGMQNNFAGGLNGYNSTAKFSGYACSGGLNLSGQGFFAGPAASRAGMAYDVYGYVYGPIYVGSPLQVNGVVAYKKQ